MNEIRNISFSKKPIPIPAEYRPTYKVAQIVYILKLNCIGNKSSLIKLHLLNWAIKSKENQTKLLDFIYGNYQNTFTTWGADPSLNRALLYCVAENICTFEKGKYVLTDKGNSFFEIIRDNESILESEKSFLTLIGKKKITDNRIKSITKKWSLFND